MVKESTPPNSRANLKKPPWQTVLTFFTKNYALLLVLLLFSETILRLLFGNNDVYPLGLDRRTAEETKSLLHTTTKMMQVQIEAVDRKIEKEIEDLRNELSERIDENDFFYGARLRDFGERVDSIGRSLISEEWLWKDEFNKSLEKLKFKKGKDEGDFRLDEMKDYVKEMIEKAIDKHAADGLGTIDYAVASGGGMVVKHSEPYNLPNGIHLSRLKILQPSFGEPGQCLLLKGNNGYVEIKLRQTIIPEAITLEHVAKSVAYGRSMAPKKCRVFGWLHPDSKKMVLLREFSYDLEKRDVQTFNVWEKGYAVNMMRFEFRSNHGDPTHTCIYRFRVLGREPNSLSSLIPQTSKNESTFSSEVMMNILQ
ncbi:unnamed protein product [Lactuca virosa]|uniref:SUN domain-containing protein n=1 Tax=Lactuca virosa TaxID=75947 RepID=A0AAU9NRH6_9ASTR|nr:unnamed protein product [Lactuca virosa]